MLEEISLKNFRNLNITALKPSIYTIFFGENAQGKTNILEAIYLLAYGKSFRKALDEVINWQEDQAVITAKVNNQHIQIFISRGQGTRLFLNGKSALLHRLIGIFICTIFHPQEIELVFGPPTVRRVWLDRLIATTDQNYLYALLTYQKALRHRNKLLKTEAVTPSEIEAWDKHLAANGVKIWQTRSKVVGEINDLLKEISPQVIRNQLSLTYENPLARKTGSGSEAFYLRTLQSQLALERRLKTTLFGPHRDDFKTIFQTQGQRTIFEKDLTKFGSRAEQRQAALLMKLAEARFFTTKFNQKPTILLDDVASELDEAHRQLLFEHLDQSQYIITTTNLGLLPESLRRQAKIFKVREGKADEL